MSPLIEYLWGKITQLSCDRDEQFHRGIEVLGNARSNDTHTRHVKVQGIYTPKSAITTSEDASLVGKRTSSDTYIHTQTRM